MLDDIISKNPFDAERFRLRAILRRAEERRDELVMNLVWFDSFDEARCVAAITNARIQVKQLETEERALDYSAGLEASRLAGFAAAKALGFNPKYWFSSERSVAKKLFNANAPIAENIAAMLNTKRYDLERARDILKACESDFHRYTSGVQQAAERRQELEALRQQLERFNAEFDAVNIDWQRVDTALAPAHDGLRASLAKCKKLQSELAKATALDRALSEASDGRERAKIHAECRLKFETDRPGPIVSQRSRELAREEKRLAKAKRLYGLQARIVGKQIRTVVIDGSNMLYCKGEFIGPAALQAILKPISAAQIKTVIVFDSGARGLLKCKTDKDVEALFGDADDVRVLASGAATDDVLLTAVSSDPTAFAISEDLFGEYGHKAALAEGRVLRHQIILNSVQIPELGLSATFDACAAVYPA